MLSLSKVWTLARLWYHNRLAPEYHGRGPDEIEAIFRAAGLTSRFWIPDQPAGAKS